jgi:cysteine desulfurase
MLLGGGQEHGLRSGTTNTPALAGLASAASEAQDLKFQEIRDLRDTFETRLLYALPQGGNSLSGRHKASEHELLFLPDMSGEEMAALLAAAGIIVGTGAACSAGAIQFSKTLRAMEVAHEIAAGGLRVSLSRISSLRIWYLCWNLTMYGVE